MMHTHVLEVEARLSAAFEEAQRRASQQEASRAALILQQKRRQVDEANAEALANAAGRERLAEALTAADGVTLRCRLEQKLLRRELCEEADQRVAECAEAHTSAVSSMVDNIPRAAIDHLQAPLLQETRELREQLAAAGRDHGAALAELNANASRRIVAMEAALAKEKEKVAELGRSLALAQPALRHACQELRRFRQDESQRAAADAEAIERRVKAALGLAEVRLLSGDGSSATAERAGREEVERLVDTQAAEEAQRGEQQKREAEEAMAQRLADAEGRGWDAGAAKAMEDKQQAISEAVAAALKAAREQSDSRVEALAQSLMERLHQGSPDAVKELIDARCTPFKRQLHEAKDYCRKLCERAGEETPAWARARPAPRPAVETPQASSTSSQEQHEI